MNNAKGLIEIIKAANKEVDQAEETTVDKWRTTNATTAVVRLLATHSQPVLAVIMSPRCSQLFLGHAWSAHIVVSLKNLVYERRKRGISLVEEHIMAWLSPTTTNRRPT